MVASDERSPVPDQAPTGPGPGGSGGVPRPLAAILRGVGIVEQALGGFFVVCILVLVLLQVAQRYLPVSGWVWSGELARFSLVWATAILSGHLLATDKHISFALLDNLLPPRGLRVLKAVANTVVAVCCAALVIDAYFLINTRTVLVSPAARMPLSWLYLLPAVGFGLTAIRAVLGIFLPGVTAMPGESTASPGAPGPRGSGGTEAQR